MCCDNSGVSCGYWKEGVFTSLIDGECDDCGQETVDGCTTDHCNYSSVQCEKCGWAPCDESC